jgi:predicted nucleic acid-binding protein
MRCFDSTFLVDYVRGKSPAVDRVRALVAANERLTTPAVSAAELLVGAHFRGGRELARSLEFLEELEVLPCDLAVAAEAGRVGAESMRRGTPVVGADLLVAATALHYRSILVSRDGVFSTVPGLAVEAY